MSMTKYIKIRQFQNAPGLKVKSIHSCRMRILEQLMKD